MVMYPPKGYGKVRYCCPKNLAKPVPGKKWGRQVFFRGFSRFAGLSPGGRVKESRHNYALMHNYDVWHILKSFIESS
jgi:hypothetical protein